MDSVTRALAARVREGLASGGIDAARNPAAVRALIDRHNRVHDIRTKIPPTAITAVDFAAKVDALPNDRAKASEMEHAARHHIRQNLDLDPDHYATLSERLDRIIAGFDGDWAEQARRMRDFVDEMATGRPADDADGGLDPDTEAPYFGLLARAIADGEDTALAQDLRALLEDFVREVTEMMGEEIRLAGYSHSRGIRLRGIVATKVFRLRLGGVALFDPPRSQEVAKDLVALAERRIRG